MRMVFVVFIAVTMFSCAPPYRLENVQQRMVEILPNILQPNFMDRIYALPVNSLVEAYPSEQGLKLQHQLEDLKVEEISLVFKNRGEFDGLPPSCDSIVVLTQIERSVDHLIYHQLFYSFAISPKSMRDNVGFVHRFDKRASYFRTYRALKD